MRLSPADQAPAAASKGDAREDVRPPVEGEAAIRRSADPSAVRRV